MADSKLHSTMTQKDLDPDYTEVIDGVGKLLSNVMAESEDELKSLLMKVKEESKKVGLTFNIQKTKIMSSGPMEIRADSLFSNEEVSHLSTSTSSEFSPRNMYVRGTLCFMLQAKWTPRCPD